MTTEALEEYLWDMSGEPDEHTRTLERLLGRYRLDPSDAPVGETRTANRMGRQNASKPTSLHHDAWAPDGPRCHRRT